MKQLFLCSYFAGVKNLFSDYVKEKKSRKKGFIYSYRWEQRGLYCLYWWGSANIQRFRIWDRGSRYCFLWSRNCSGKDFPKQDSLYLRREYLLFITRIKEKTTPISYQRANKRWAGLCGRISRSYHYSQGYWLQ